MMERKIKDLTEQYFFNSWEPKEYEPKEYIERLLPLEVDYLKSKDRFSEVTETDVLVQLVGFSWEPLFISLCAHQPKILVLVLNKKYNEKPGISKGRDYEEYICKLKAAKLISSEPQIFPDFKDIRGAMVEDTPDSVFKFLRKNVLPFVNEGKRVVIDITGAKKSMVSGAYLFATYSNSLVSYLDFEVYSKKYGKPYGYTCLIKKPENPIELFKISEWSKAREQYNQYAFGNALKIIKDIEKETIKYIEPEEKDTVALLKECLCFYELWDNGDYRMALEKYKEIQAKIPSFPCLSVVQELGEFWFSNEDYKNTTKQLEGLEDINQSIYLDGRKILIYAQDELNKISRLIEYKEDYRSALLRAIGLNDFLFKTRLIRLWVNNLLQIDINGKISVRFDLDNEYKKTVDQGLLTYSVLNNIINLLLKKGKKPITIKIDKPEEKAKVMFIDKTPTMEKFWDKNQNLNPYDLFYLRNKAIHFCLSVSKDKAEAAYNLAKGNFNELQKNWVTEGKIGREYERLEWDELCEICGINFLPRQRGDKDE